MFSIDSLFMQHCVKSVSPSSLSHIVSHVPELCSPHRKRDAARSSLEPDRVSGIHKVFALHVANYWNIYSPHHFRSIMFHSLTESECEYI